MGLFLVPRQDLYIRFGAAVHDFSHHFGDQEKYKQMVALQDQIEREDQEARKVFRLSEIAEHHAMRAYHAGDMRLFALYAQRMEDLDLRFHAMEVAHKW